MAGVYNVTTGLRHILRRQERRLMDGRCNITRGEAGTSIHANLPCIVVPAERATRQVEAGGQQVTLHLYDVVVPHDATVQKDDVVTVTVSADPGMVGRYLIVLEVTKDEWVTNRRLVCTEGRA